MALQLLTIALNADQLLRVDAAGQSMQILTATGSFEFGFTPGSLVTGREDDLLTEPFSALYFRDTSGSANTIKIRYGDNVVFGRSKSIDFGGVSQPIDIQNWPVDPITGTFTPEIYNQIVPKADVTVTNVATLISAAAATKRLTLITVPADAAASVRIGDNTVDGTHGVEILPGTTVPVSGSVAVYGYASSDVDVSIAELSSV